MFKNVPGEYLLRIHKKDVLDNRLYEFLLLLKLSFLVIYDM